MRKDIGKDIEEMEQDSKDILVATIYKETQVGRSISKNKKVPEHFKENLLVSIRKLRELVDTNKIKNADIRSEIKRVNRITGASIGQSQKVINVYLKFYCLILHKPLKVIKELDCPLDSTTMNKKQTMKKLEKFEEYEDWQNEFLKDCGIRILRDKEYDANRKKKSLGI